MRPAGDYPDRLDWRRRTPGPPDGFGQRADTWASQGHLWGVVEDLAGSRTTRQEGERQLTTATVRLRNYPAIAAGDQLHDTGRAETWRVLSARRGDNETVCDVERL